MTTKEQERKALEQIRKIVEGLGKDSYIATAFEGAFEDAEYNIRDDAAYSMKSRWESAKAERDTLELKVAQNQKTIKEDNAVIEHHAKYIDQLEAKNNELLERLRKTEEVGSENIKTLISYQSKAEQQANEIIHLKAKLYDLMTK
mgnify:CR=1 FL=1